MTTEELDLDGPADRETDEEPPDFSAATAQALADDEALWAADEPPPKDPTPLPNVPSPPPEVPSAEQKAANLRDVVPAAYLYGTTLEDRSPFQIEGSVYPRA